MPDDETIIWAARETSNGDASFHAAPLDVGPMLAEGLYDRKESVVMTSATLSTEGNFGYFKGRTGLPEDSDELLVGSPFDYQKAALLLMPSDMPTPTTDGYAGALARVLADLGTSLGGRTMALFTSYSSLRAVANRIRAPLQAEGIQVLAQSIDGPPQQLIARFTHDPRSVLLGTASFWEGVDLPNGVLQALVLTRLPFPGAHRPGGQGQVGTVRRPVQAVFDSPGRVAIPAGHRPADSQQRGQGDHSGVGPKNHGAVVWAVVPEVDTAVYDETV